MSLVSVRRAARVASAVLLTAVLAACGGGGDGGTTNPPPSVGDFGLTLSSTTLSVVQGGTSTLTASVARTGSFTGTVDISAEGLPAGVTASFNPSTVGAGVTSTVLTVTATTAAAPGTFTFTIRGRATGIADKTGQATLTVTAAPAIAVALTPTSGTVVQGASTAIATTVTRTNFTGAVTLGVTGAPTGVTTTVAQNGDAGTVTVNVGATATPGTSTLTITATGTGVAAATATYALTVTAAPTGSYAVALNPAALSVQQGANGQTTVTLTRTNFTAPVALAVTGAPNGVTPAFGQTTLNNAETTTTLTLAVAGNAAAGTSTLTVTATSGATTQSATLTLTVTAAPAGSIALTLSAANATVTVGNATTFTVNVARTNYAGNVAVALTGVPNGVTPTITTTPTAGNSVQVQLAVGAGAAPGSYGITVTGSGTGIPNATAQFTLTVNAVPAIALALTPTNAIVQQGNNTTITVALNRTNFAGNVTLAVTGAPNGVTATYSTNPVAVDGATITLAVGSGVTPGVYQLTVTGSGTGIANSSASFALTVQQAAAGSGNITWTFGFCGTGDIPIWVAAQDGNGAWQRVVGVNNSYSFTITTKGGIAYVTQNGANDYDISFYYGSVTEMQSRGGTICPSAATKTLNGTIANMGTSAQALVTVGGGSASVLTPATTFQVTGVRPGAVDLVASRLGIDFANPTAGFQVNKMIIRRGINPADGSTLPVLDFNAAESFTPVSRTLTINGGSMGEQLAGGVVYFTQAGGSATLGTGLATGNTVNYASVPAGNQIATDLHVVSGFGTTVTGGSNTSSRIVSEVFKDAVNKAVTLPAALNMPTFTTLANAPYLRNRVQLARQAEYDDAWVLGYAQTGRSVSVYISSGYLGSDPFDFAFPDFSAVGGWQDTWGLTGGASTTYNISASGWTLGGTGFENPYIEGTVIRTGARTGQFTP